MLALEHLWVVCEGHEIGLKSAPKFVVLSYLGPAHVAIEVRTIMQLGVKVDIMTKFEVIHDLVDSKLPQSLRRDRWLRNLVVGIIWRVRDIGARKRCRLNGYAGWDDEVDVLVFEADVRRCWGVGARRLHSSTVLIKRGVCGVCVDDDGRGIFDNGFTGAIMMRLFRLLNSTFGFGRGLGVRGVGAGVRSVGSIRHRVCLLLVCSG